MFIKSFYGSGFVYLLGEGELRLAWAADFFLGRFWEAIVPVLA